MGGYRLLGLGARRSCLAEEVIVRHAVLVLELVDELLVEECEDVVVFQLDLIGLERPLGLAEHGQRAQVPRPQVLGASQRTVGDDAGFLERLLHVRAQRRDRAKAATVVRDHERHTVDREHLEAVLGNVGNLADALPAHDASLVSRLPRLAPLATAALTPVRRKSRRATLLRSASATPCRADGCRDAPPAL